MILSCIKKLSMYLFCKLLAIFFVTKVSINKDYSVTLNLFDHSKQYMFTFIEEFQIFRTNILTLKYMNSFFVVLRDAHARKTTA